MVRLAPGRAEIIDEVPSGRLYVDGGMLTPENGDALRERRHAAFNGVLIVSVVLDGKGRMAADSQVRAHRPARRRGISAGRDVLDDLADEAEKRDQGAGRRRARGRRRGRGRRRRALKKASQRIWERRPVVETTVLRI